MRRIRPLSRAGAAAVAMLPGETRARMAQSLTNGRLVGHASAERLRRALVHHGGDPTVEADIDGIALRLPLSHALPVYRRAFPGYSENLGEVARLVAMHGGLTMIDVGANVGDSVAIVKARVPDMAILCVEADPAYVGYLEENTARWSDVVIAAPVLLAERTDEIDGTIRRADGSSRVATGAPGTTPALALDDLVASHEQFCAPALLKSDTDGFEARVLRGAQQVLATGPVLFLEYDPKLLEAAGSDGLDMLASLQPHGYERIAFYDKFGVLVVRCALSDQSTIRDLHAYAAVNRKRGVDHYDIVVGTPKARSIIDSLPIIPASPRDGSV